MQFSSEFEWISPSGRGLLTHYMPAHYSAGWWMDESTTVTEAEQAAYELFAELKKVALTRNVLLPVGTDYTPPNKWVTEIHRDWASRYTWPRFVCALPREFFAAVRAELDDRAEEPSPQTRDMNPIYTGKDVSFIDTKQANRAAEDAVLDAEKFAVFAGLLAGADYPQAALAKAWVQLAYGAHHDAITGSESDQVYLDLLTGWREAWELGRAGRDNSLAVLSSAVDGDVVVWNALAHNRTDIVTARLKTPIGERVRVLDHDGGALPAVVEHGGRSVSWLARDVPSLGWRAYRLVAADSDSGWEPLAGNEIANEHYRLAVDPDRGGGVSSLVRHGKQLIADGRVGNELAVYQEYPAHPTGGEGPWHLLPKGPVVGSSETPARGAGLPQPAGTAAGRARPDRRYAALHTNADVVARRRPGRLQHHHRRLHRRRPTAAAALAVPGAGRDAGQRSWRRRRRSRFCAAAQRLWIGGHRGTPVDAGQPGLRLVRAVVGGRVRVGDGVRAVSVAEVVAATEPIGGQLARDLVVALVRAGVTATCSSADKPRYGHLDVDSNLPDTRIALGGPGQNTFTKAVLAAADPAYTREVEQQLAKTGRATVWVPAAAPLTESWIPGADLRDAQALPVLVIAGRDDAHLAAAVASVADDLADAEIVVTQHAPAGRQRFESRTVALCNRGVPSFAVESDGTLHTALMRSCTGWPSGIWIDEPRRTAPDGSNFQLQHWTHVFDYALICGAGDWRHAEVPDRSAEFSRPLQAVTAPGSVGGLPSAGSLLQVDPAGAVQLGALKAAGNPMAHGSAHSVDAGHVAIRLVETRGSDADVVVRSPLGTVSELRSADLLEQPQGRSHLTTLHGHQIGTALARLDLPRLLDGEDVALAANAETAQPLYARYWLHNRGPAPLGGLPAVAHLHPHQLTAAAGSEATLRLTVASDSSDATLAGDVTLSCPPGWSASPAALPFTLSPGEHLEADVIVKTPKRVEPGLYPVRAQLQVTGAEAPVAWRQVVEDVALICVGGTDDRGLVYLTDEPADVVVTAGNSARLAATVGTDACADLSLEAHLISPWGTWEWISPSVLGAVLPARGTVDIGFDVSPPAWLEPGQWWALIRIGCAGRLVYSPAVKVTVR